MSAPSQFVPMLVGVDAGPRACLQPLAAHFGVAVEGSEDDAATPAFWEDRIERVRPDVLVAGTSDSASGRQIESAARIAARSHGVPIVAIEDFPGNYYHVAGGEAALVLVESEGAREIALLKFGARAPALAVISPARYDPYRARIGAVRAAGAGRHSRSVLWAGQPETEDCVRTLAALVPIVQDHYLDLLFKAHPRDAGYGSGSYAHQIAAAGVSSVDVTAEPLESVLASRPLLVVTQFSSVAIEAGFYGIPGLWVLLPGAGRDRLREKKGYATPPLCLAGGAFCTDSEASLAAEFAGALSDRRRRAHVRKSFDAYFDVRSPQLPATLRALAETPRQTK